MRPPAEFIRRHGYGTALARLERNAEQDGECRVLRQKIRSPQIRVSVRGRVWTESAPRVVWESAHGEIPDGYQVERTCRNRGCVALAHLELRKVRSLDAEAVERVRREARQPGDIARLAGELGVAPSTVGNVVHGASYAEDRARWRRGCAYCGSAQHRSTWCDSSPPAPATDPEPCECGGGPRETPDTGCASCNQIDGLRLRTHPAVRRLHRRYLPAACVDALTAGPATVRQLGMRLGRELGPAGGGPGPYNALSVAIARMRRRGIVEERGLDEETGAKVWALAEEDCR